ncbi:MAG: glycosyltransferase family 9 protein, partial [Proteobacteria bacterium]
MKKAVFIRLDKIGDLVCTLPVDQIDGLIDWDITWVIAKGLSFVTDHAEPKRKYIELDKNNPSDSRARLEHFLKELRPDVAISFQAPWWVQLVLWKCRVPVRIGVRSKWDSFFFLNKGLRQKRSRAVQHEADYNLDLVRQMNIAVAETHAPVLKLVAPPAGNVLSKYGLQ